MRRMAGKPKDSGFKVLLMPCKIDKRQNLALVLEPRNKLKSKQSNE